jgi:hypothetical protein
MDGWIEKRTLCISLPRSRNPGLLCALFDQFFAGAEESGGMVCWHMGEDKGFHTYRGPCSIHGLFESKIEFREDLEMNLDERLPLPAHVDVEGSAKALRMGVGEEEGERNERVRTSEVVNEFGRHYVTWA